MNLKHEFAVLTDGRPRTMKEALRFMSLPLEGRHHRGIDDARNIARLAVWILPRMARDAGPGLHDGCSRRRWTRWDWHRCQLRANQTGHTRVPAIQRDTLMQRSPTPSPSGLAPDWHRNA